MLLYPSANAPSVSAVDTDGTLEKLIQRTDAMSLKETSRSGDSGGLGKCRDSGDRRVSSDCGVSGDGSDNAPEKNG